MLPFIAPEHVVYFRDIYDHAVHLSDEYDGFRELVTAALDVYLSTVNNNLSLIMKRLTGITVVLAGLGAFAGIFGMSEAGAAFARTEAVGFWMVTASIVGAVPPDRRDPAADRLDLRRGPRRYWQAIGLAVGFASPGSAGPTLSGRAITIVLPIVPRGPSDVWSISCSSVASKASSRLLWLRRTRVTS